jgi:hypothetical protein
MDMVVVQIGALMLALIIAGLVYVLDHETVVRVKAEREATQKYLRAMASLRDEILVLVADYSVPYELVNDGVDREGLVAPDEPSPDWHGAYKWARSTSPQAEAEQSPSLDEKPASAPQSDEGRNFMFSRKTFVVVMSLVLVFALSAVSAFAQIPTAEPITAATYADAVNGSIGVLQMLGLVGFIVAAIVLLNFAPRLFRRFVGGGR